MKTKKSAYRVAAGLLAVFSLCPFMTACASDSNTTTNQIETNSVAVTTEAVTEPVPPEYTPPTVDYGSEAFCFLDYQTNDYFWQAATYSDIYAEAENGDILNDALYRRNITVEEELNIKITTHAVGGAHRGENANEFRKIVLAGEDTIQAGFIFGTLLPSLLKEPGLLVDLNSIPDLNLDASWWNQSVADTFTINDQLLFTTGDISLYTSFSPVLLFFNKQVAADNDINDMYDLVREGKWTIDKMIEYSAMVSADLNGDSKYTEEDQYGMGIGSHMVNEFIYGGDQQYIQNDNGTMKIIVNTEKTVDIIGKIVPFINDTRTSIAHHNYTSKYSNVFYDMFMPMFENNQLLFYNNQLLIAFELRAMEADFGILPMPKYDETQKNYVSPISHSWSTMLCIPSTNQVPEMTADVLNAMGYYSQQYVTPAFIDTTVYNKALRDDDSAEMLGIILDNLFLDVSMLYNWGNLYTKISEMGAKANTNFSSLYASIESQIQADMEKYLSELDTE